MTLEVEVKYDAPAAAEVPDLTGLEPVASVERSGPEVLEATYFDTEDLRLIGSGFTLRRRTGGDDAGWHLKIPVEDGRHEIRVPLARAKVQVPKRLRDLVLALVGDRALDPVATVRTERTTYRLRDADGTMLAELADDVVAASSGQEQSAWREWELELRDGDRGLLETGGGLLEENGATRSDAAAKLARAMADRLAVPVLPDQRRKGPSAAVVQARLTEQLRQLRACDPAVREDLPEGIHDMRVATRRLRNALATYRPFLDRSVTEPLREELAWLADALGQARDAEVLAARIGGLAEEQAGEPVAVDLVWVRSRLRERYDAAYTRLTATLGSDRYFALLGRLEELTTSAPWTVKAEKPVGKQMSKRVRHDWDRLARRMAAAESIDEHAERSESRAEALHSARKAVKRVRYAVEPLVPIFGLPAERFVSALKDLQTELGDHHDSQTSRAELRRLAGETEDGHQALGLGVLHERERVQAARLEAEATAAWEALSKKKMRAWLR